MLNKPEAYRELGMKTCRARIQHDHALAGFYRRHLDKMVALEKPEDRRKARDLFDEGYKEEVKP